MVKNFLSSAGNQQDEILEYLKKEKGILADQDLIIVFWEKGKTKKSSEIFKWLVKEAKSQEFEKPIGIKLDQWILKKIKAIDSQSEISSGAVEKLILYAGGDLVALSQEIMKLVNYTGGKIIREEEVDLLVQANFDLNIFNTIDALGNRNKKEALKFLHQHLKKGEDPFYIFSMFVYQFRNILKITDLKENYQMNEQEIAKTTALHPYVVRKGLAQARNFSFDTLKKIYQKLANLDVKIKTGQIDIKLALDKFIVEI
jgi:DNA polymerase-3 subunit delta